MALTRIAVYALFLGICSSTRTTFLTKELNAELGATALFAALSCTFRIRAIDAIPSRDTLGRLWLSVYSRSKRRRRNRKCARHSQSIEVLDKKLSIFKEVRSSMDLRPVTVRALKLEVISA